MSIPSRPSATSANGPVALPRLPDFRNQGIWLRLLLMANLMMLAAAIAANRQPLQLLQEVSVLAARTEPALLFLLSLLYALAPWLLRLHWRLAMLLVVALATLIMTASDTAFAVLLGSSPDWRAPFAGGAGMALMLAWLDVWARARAPAIAEARLTALTARIRPHFLFNSLNAVLGVIREDPRRAEATLEELAELFRALMRENRTLVPLADEIALAQKYVEIERLRLGERLQVNWTVGQIPADILAPPLLLQPLIENAVRHGIEPVAEPGRIAVRIAPTREGVRLEIDNPWCGDEAARPGNRMALDNLRERLMLFYDLEARLDTGVSDGRFCVRIDLPARHAHG